MASKSNTTAMQSGATVEGLKEALRAFQQLDKDGRTAVRDEVQKVANVLARQVASAGRNTGDPRNIAIAGTIRGTRERSPVIKIGSAKRFAGAGRARTSDLMLGMEFGSTGLGGDATDLKTSRGGRPGWRFPARTPRSGRGNEGYWVFPTLRSQQSKAVELWGAALNKATADWGR